MLHLPPDGKRSPQRLLAKADSIGRVGYGLNDAYMLLIASFDLFGKELYRYTFRMTCEEVPGLKLEAIKSSEEMGVKYMREWEEKAFERKSPAPKSKNLANTYHFR